MIHLFFLLILFFIIKKWFIYFNNQLYNLKIFIIKRIRIIIIIIFEII